MFLEPLQNLYSGIYSSRCHIQSFPESSLIFQGVVFSSFSKSRVLIQNPEVSPFDRNTSDNLSSLNFYYFSWNIPFSTENPSFMSSDRKKFVIFSILFSVIAAKDCMKRSQYQRCPFEVSAKPITQFTLTQKLGETLDTCSARLGNLGWAVGIFCPG